MRAILPSRTLPVSVTGRECALSCAHCNKRYLTHMVPLSFLSRKLAEGRYTSLLVSGGCTREGKVPVEPHAPYFISLRKKYPFLRIVSHSGFADETTATALRTFADVVSFDYLCSTAIIREVYGLSKTYEELLDSLSLLRKHVPVVPHLTVGLQGGRITAEKQGIEHLVSLGFSRVVLNVFIPTPQTAYARCSPPSPHAVAEVCSWAVSSGLNVTVGCMRPKARYRDIFDPLVAEIVEGIVQPSHVVPADLISEVSHECCVL